MVWEVGRNYLMERKIDKDRCISESGEDPVSFWLYSEMRNGWTEIL